MGKCRPSYSPAYGNELTGVTDTNIAMSQFRRKTKILKSEFTYRIFKNSTYTFTAGAGGKGGDSSWAGGGGAGGIFVNSGGSHLASILYPSVNSRFRWGFIYNENNLNDFSSSDVGSGIGMRISYASAGTNMSYSASDAITCCQSNTGINRSMRVELYGR